MTDTPEIQKMREVAEELAAFGLPQLNGFKGDDLILETHTSANVCYGTNLGLLASSDVISRLFDRLFSCVADLSDSTFHFSIKAMLLFLVPLLLCTFFMRRHPPSVFSQVILCVVGVFIVSAIPVDQIEIASPMIKTWLWIGSTVLLCFLPALLATVLVPTVGDQRKLSKILYWVLAVLFVLNLFTRN